jgi:hypothetical protein
MTMSVWRSPSGALHWLRRCSGSGGVRKVRRTTVNQARLAEAYAAGKVCRCLWKVEFSPGKRAQN